MTATHPFLSALCSFPFRPRCPSVCLHLLALLHTFSQEGCTRPQHANCRRARCEMLLIRTTDIAPACCCSGFHSNWAQKCKVVMDLMGEGWGGIKSRISASRSAVVFSLIMILPGCTAENCGPTFISCRKFILCVCFHISCCRAIITVSRGCEVIKVQSRGFSDPLLIVFSCLLCSSLRLKIEITA